MSLPETAVHERPTVDAADRSHLRRTLSRLSLLDLVIVALCLWATLRTTQGKFLWLDVNFDLRYYHAYNGWALFNDGLRLDLHPGGGASYYNPVLDALNYLAMSIVPARVGSLLLLFLQLSSVVPVYVIARRLMPTWRRSFALGAAILSMGGATVTSEWGTTFGDLTSAPPVLWAVALLLHADASRGLRPALAGALLGVGFALKLTNAPYVLAGTVLALFVLLPRVIPLVKYAGGGLLGYLTVSGPWMWLVAQETSNPLFPLFNDVFKSPYYPQSGAVDGRFASLAMGFGESLMLPFKFVAAPAYLTGELPFSEWRWAVWAVAVILLGVILLLQLPGSALPRTSLPPSWQWRSSPMRSLVGLQVFLVVAFLFWANYIGLQRYGIVIEILTVPAIIGLLSHLTVRNVGLAVLVGSLAIGLGWNTMTMDWGRIPMPSGPAIPPGSVTALQEMDTIIVADTQPSAYVTVAVGGTAENGNRPVWLGKPFTEMDRRKGLSRLEPGRVGVLVRVDYGDPVASAAVAAEWFDLVPPRRCNPVPVPLGDPMAICPVMTPEE